MSYKFMVDDNLGHATVAFTLDIYVHVTEEMKKASSNRMENYIKSVAGMWLYEIVKKFNMVTIWLLFWKVPNLLSANPAQNLQLKQKFLTF